MSQCILCQETWQGQAQEVRLTPRCAGLRILTLDDGGVRGILELKLLEKIVAAVDQDIPVRDLFDLVVGTGTGKKLTHTTVPQANTT